MITNPYYSPEFHGDYKVVSIGRLELEEGGVIEDCRLAYTTWGTLSPDKDNAILITTWYSGTHQIWRDVYVGPDHALNPEAYFIVCVDQIGSGLSTSLAERPADPSVSAMVSPARSTSETNMARVWSRSSAYEVMTPSSHQ